MLLWKPLRKQIYWNSENIKKREAVGGSRPNPKDWGRIAFEAQMSHEMSEITIVHLGIVRRNQWEMIYTNVSRSIS